MQCVDETTLLQITKPISIKCPPNAQRVGWVADALH